jgi:predicted esterase
MQENYLKVEKTARYTTLGQCTPALEKVIYIFHGYGQLATSFIEEFSYFADGTKYFIAPEGLSRFYVSGKKGKVGASWMTSEHREQEIGDYLTYLDDVYRTENKKIPEKDIQTILLGFSQGVATVCRWLENLNIKADRLILWGGEIPPELALWRIRAHLPKLEVYLVAGTKDPFVRFDLLKDQEQRLENAQIPYKKIRFDGKHELHPPTLQKLL